MKVYIWVLVVQLAAVSAQQLINDALLTRKLSTGKLRGKLVRTQNGKNGYAYLGIPYARVPVGPLRFADAVRPARAWPAVLDATQYGHSCMSNSSRTTSPQSDVSEDCLTVNVFSSAGCLVRNLVDGACPVIYYIHGGGFTFDAPSLYPEATLVDNFASRGVVFVSVGYRLGTFGFWQTPVKTTAGATGNYGLSDLLAGLEWIQDEIEAFGGDPARVSVMGHSSGAAAASLLSVLPAAQGLFQNVIELSGALYVDESVYTPAYSSAQWMAVSLDCASDADWTQPTDNATWEAVVDCMRNRSAHEIIVAQRELEDLLDASPFPSPVVDGRLVPAYPSELKTQRSSALRIMTGITADEFGSRDNVDSDNATQLQAALQTQCLHNAVLYENRTESEPHLKLVVDKCVQFYASRGAEGYTNLYNFDEGIQPAYEEARSVVEVNGTVYLFSLDFKKNNESLNHIEYLTYIMGSHPFPYDARDIRIRDELVGLLVNFAKSGDPTPLKPATQRWRPVQELDNVRYYSVDLPVSTMQPMFHYPDVNFWTSSVPALEVGANYEDERQGVTQPPLEEQVSELAEQAPPPVRPDDSQQPAPSPDASPATDTDDKDARQGFNFKLAFYIVLVVAILLFLIIVAFSLIRLFKKPPQNGQVTERTPLLAGQNTQSAPAAMEEAGAASVAQPKRKSTEETALFGETTTVPTDAEDSLTNIEETSNEKSGSTRRGTDPPEPESIPLSTVNDAAQSELTPSIQIEQTPVKEPVEESTPAENVNETELNYSEPKQTETELEKAEVAPDNEETPPVDESKADENAPLDKQAAEELHIAEAVKEAEGEDGLTPLKTDTDDEELTKIAAVGDKSQNPQRSPDNDN